MPLVSSGVENGNLRELALNAWVLNYANPMAMNTWTLTDAGHRRTIGLCHSILGDILDDGVYVLLVHRRMNWIPRRG